MASPTVDGLATAGTVNNGSSIGLTLTTTKTNDVVCVCVVLSHPSAFRTVSSITSSGLSFTLRKRQQVTGGTADVDVEIWTAFSTGILTAQAITVNLSAATDAGIADAIGINGVFSSSNIFDPNAGLTAVNTAVSSNSFPTVTYSTTNADDLLILVTGLDKVATGFANPAGWTNERHQAFSGATKFATIGISVKSVSAAQTAQTVTDSASSVTSADIASLVDAFTADANSVAYTLACATGAYSIAGQAITMHLGRNIAPTTGAYSISGKAVLFAGVRTLSAATGAYVVGGVAAAGKVGHTLVAVTGAYLINGQAAGFHTSKRIAPATGAYVIAGQAAAFHKGLSIAPVTGLYLITGTAPEFTVTANYHATFADFNNTTFLDWGSADFASFLVISQTDETVDTKEQAPYIYTFLKQTEDSDEDSEGATVTGYWDWANDSTSKRVTQPQEIYHFRDGFLVCARRHKMRGRGRQLQLRYDSETGKNFNLLGWALFYVHNAQQ